MKLRLRSLWILTLGTLWVFTPSLAQRPAVDAYRARVKTKDGRLFRGILMDITEADLYLVDQQMIQPNDRVPLDLIDKVAIRRKNQTPVLVTGAIVGGLAIGYLANQSLLANRTRSPVAHGLTLTFAAAGGATAGLLLGSAAGNLTRRIIRPLNAADAKTSLIRQLEPFCIRYQQDLIDRLPKTIP